MTTRSPTALLVCALLMAFAATPAAAQPGDEVGSDAAAEDTPAAPGTAASPEQPAEAPADEASDGPPPAGDSAPPSSEALGTPPPPATPVEPSDASSAEAMSTEAAPTEPDPAEGTTPPTSTTEGGAPTDGEEGDDGLSTAARATSVSPTAGGLRWSLPLSFDQSFNLRGFRRDAQLTYYPIYTWSLSARPRWNVNDHVSVGMRQDFLLELTRSQFTDQPRRLWVDDTRFDLAYTLSQRPGGFIFTPRVLARLPVSPLSRGSGRFLNLGGGLLVFRPFDVLGGLIVSASASYRYWFGRRGGVRSESGFPCARAGVGTSSGCRQIGSASSVADVTTISVGAQLIPKDRVSLSIGFAWIGLRGHKLTTACLDDGTVLTADNPVCFGDASDTHLRSQTVFSLSAGYDVRDYFTLRLNFVTLALHPDRDGSRENPIFNELSTISLTAVFRVGGYVASRRAAADDLQ